MALGIRQLIDNLTRGHNDAAAQFYGKKITAVTLDDKELRLTFSDDIKARLWDDGQNCCEHRYITCDDDVQALVGGTLVNISSRIGDETEDKYDGIHETAFVIIATDQATVTLCTHNEHNGYYGGFSLADVILHAPKSDGVNCKILKEREKEGDKP